MKNFNKKLHFLILIFTIYLTNNISFSNNIKNSDEIENYTIDAFHSVVMFEVKNYAQLGNIVVGRFNKIEGTVNINKKDFTKSKANIKIYVNSLDTGWKERDEHLLGPNFFDVKNYPLITFESKNIKSLTNNEFILNGDLTLLNTTKNINIIVKELNKGKNFMNNDIIVYEFNYSINRSDFGMNKMLELVGDKVEITAFIQINKIENKIK